MIVNNDIKRQFVNDVNDNSIANKILEAIKMRGLNAGHEKEYSSWQNSKGSLHGLLILTRLRKSAVFTRPKDLNLTMSEFSLVKT